MFQAESGASIEINSGEVLRGLRLTCLEGMAALDNVSNAIKHARI